MIRLRAFETALDPDGRHLPYKLAPPLSLFSASGSLFISCEQQCG